MAIDYQRKDYEYHLTTWQMLDDVCNGERAVKDRDRIRLSANSLDPVNSAIDNQKRYLPIPNVSDTSQKNLLRYSQYLARAVFYNATGRTLSGLIGMAFRKPPELDLGAIDYLVDDTDGQGVGLNQQVQSTTAEVFKKGRHALWVDYPAVDSARSIADMQSGEIRANVISVTAEQVVNWRTEKVGTSHKLSLVVISECIEEIGDDGYTIVEIEQHRVLRLSPYAYSGGERVDISGYVYSIEIFRKDELQAAYTPKTGVGEYWEVIPFTFIGSVDNNATIDHAPLYDMAVVNLAHYRNSADYEDSCFFVGQAQTWISGLDTQWRDWMVSQEMYIGSRTPIMLPENGRFGIEQAEPNILVKEAMDSKEQQMIALGARLVTPGEAVKTATEAQSDNEAEHSVLSLVAENVNQAYNTALQWAADYMRASGDPKITMNTDFVDYKMDAQMILAKLAAWQGRALPTSDLIRSFKRAGHIDPDKTTDEVLEELADEDPGLGLND